MLRRILFICLIITVFMLPFGVHAQEFDRNGMLSSIVENVILPQHEAFIGKTAGLESALVTLSAEPTLENLTAAQEQWRATVNHWSELVIFGLHELMLIHNQIDKTPPNINFIEGFIADEPMIDEAFIESIGSTSKGLPAIEYLLFDPAGDNQHILDQLQTPQRMQYLVALGQNLYRKAQELYDAWLPDKGDYASQFLNADETGTVLNSSITDLTNEMVYLVEKILHMKLGVPLGDKNGGEPVPEESEAYLSGQSLPLMIHDLQGIEAAFTGGAGLGFDDYLNFLGAEYEGKPLSEATIQQIDMAVAALERIEQPLSIAVVENPEAVVEAQEAVRQLLVLFKVDIANQLGVTITFNDSDGD